MRTLMIIMLFPLLGLAQQKPISNNEGTAHLESIYKEMYEGMYGSTKVRPLRVTSQIMTVNYRNANMPVSKSFFVTEYNIFPGNTILDVTPSFTTEVKPLVDNTSFIRDYMASTKKTKD